MNHRKSRMGTNRDFGTEGAGKGDSDRTTDRAAYANNLAEIPLGGHVEGFRKVGLKFVKTYGKRDPALFQCLMQPPQACSSSPWVGIVSITNDLVRE